LPCQNWRGSKSRQQAAYDAEDAGVTDERAIKRLQDNYAATEKHSGRKDQKKEDKAAESEAKKLATGNQ
jgi:hypothetical protein